MEDKERGSVLHKQRVQGPIEGVQGPIEEVRNGSLTHATERPSPLLMLVGSTNLTQGSTNQTQGSSIRATGTSGRTTQHGLTPRCTTTITGAIVPSTSSEPGVSTTRRNYRTPNRRPGDTYKSKSHQDCESN